MAVDLMETVKAMLTPELVGKAAETTGESPDSARKAMHGAVPAVFAGLVQSASAPGGSARIFSAITAGGAGGSGLMSNVLGERSGAVGNALGKSSGIPSSSASHILSLVFPIAAGVLGKQILAKGMNPAGFSQMLFGHKKAIMDSRDTPPGLAEALGVGSLSEIGGAQAEVAQPHISSATTPEEYSTGEATRAMESSVASSHRRSRLGGIVPALVVAALAVWGILALARSHGPKPGVTAPQPTLPTMPKLPSLHAPEAPGFPKGEAPTAGPITLPGGKVLDVDKNGPEAQMAAYLSNSSAPLPHTFALDNLNFESGTANLTPASEKTVDDLAVLLHAYPSAQVRVEGHTDSVGDPAANLKLSQARATTLAEKLAAKGVARERIDVAGRSQESPVAENGSPEGRARNRRVDIVLLSR
jgi:OmpA-OmpF porin, OOP family